MRQILIHCLLVLTGVAPLTACSGYVLRGKVVEGFEPGISFVTPDDPRLQDPGVGDTVVTIVRDPDSLGRSEAGSATSGLSGQFTMPIGEFGAGWLQEEWLLAAHRSGYRTTEQKLSLPREKSGLLLLVVMTPGRSIPSASDNLMDQYEHFRSPD